MISERKVHFVIISDVGNSREINEDNFFLFSYPASEETNRTIDEAICKDMVIDGNKFFCVLSDGMGGHDYGEVASRKVAEYLSQNRNNLLQATLYGKKAISDYITSLNFQFCDFAKSNKKYNNMGATLCGFAVSYPNAFCFNVGDSRMYQLKNGLLSQITVDHSEGQRLLGLDLLTEDEVKHFPKRKAIYKYVGQVTTLIPDVFALSGLDTESIIMLCTDGLTDVVSDEEIKHVLSEDNVSLKDKGKRLTEMAKSRNVGLGDNITLAIAEF